MNDIETAFVECEQKRLQGMNVLRAAVKSLERDLEVARGKWDELAQLRAEHSALHDSRADLLAVAKLVVEWLDKAPGDLPPGWAGVRETCRAAIAKAEGAPEPKGE